MSNFGTPGLFESSCVTDDAPCKNWAGTAISDFPDFKEIGGEKVIAQQVRKYGCWHCPVSCGGHMRAGTGEYKDEVGAISLNMRRWPCSPIA